MDIKLQNAYVEVLLGNFMEVVKQNLMFQAQLEMFKSEVAEGQAIKRKIDELTVSNNQLQKTIQDQSKELQDKTKQVSLVNSSDNLILKQEKDRLQNAVNDYMRQLKESQQKVLEVKSESQDVLLQNTNRIEELTKYVTRLEAVVSANKLKKVKLGEVIQPDSPEITVELPSVTTSDDNVKSGGTF